MALLTHVLPTASQVLTAVSKITYAESKIFNLLTVDLPLPPYEDLEYGCHFDGI